MLGLWEYNFTSWPAVIQTLTAGLSITTADKSGQGVSKTYSLDIQGSTSSSYTGLAISTGGTSLTLPLSNATGGINFTYIKNTGNFPITVTWTPFQGASNIVKTIQPGGFMFDGNSALGSGITSLSLTAVGGNSSVDCVLFG